MMIRDMVRRDVKKRGNAGRSLSALHHVMHYHVTPYHVMHHHVTLL
jgi:hypothetical protein